MDQQKKKKSIAREIFDFVVGIVFFSTGMAMIFKLDLLQTAGVFAVAISFISTVLTLRRLCW